MNIGRLVFSVPAIALGVFIFVYGGYDDSPGAQLLGFVIVALGIFRIVKGRKKNS